MMIKNFKKIQDDSELKSQLENFNNIELLNNQYNLNVIKNIRKDEPFILEGNNSVINGDLIIKSINDIFIYNLNVKGRIEILARNIEIKNIDNNYLTDISAAKIYLDGKYKLNDFFIFGDLFLKNNVIIETNGFHIKDSIFYNNYSLDIKQLNNPKILNSNIKINDPSLNLQTCLNLTNIIDSWQFCDLSKTTEIKVAVLDTGVDADHPEIFDNFCKNHEGKIIGQRFFDGNSDDNFDDDNGHGTHVAGIIAAKSNNNLGISGMSANNKIKIIPIKCINKFEDGYYSKNLDIANAIKWAVDKGADIINLSLGGFPSSDLIKNNIRYALRMGCLVVAAAGNSSHPQKRGFVEYPAALPEVLSVGSLDEENNLSYFSSYKTDDEYPEKPEGHRGVDVVAPGAKIYSTFDHSDSGTYNNSYCYMTGTSMATPIVTGVAALLMQQHSHYYRNPSIVRKVLIQTAKDCGIPGYDQEYGYGLIDAKAAITYPFTINQPSENKKKYLQNETKPLENNINQNQRSVKDSTGDKILNSIKSNGVYYGAGLAAMLGYFYYSNSKEDEQKEENNKKWENITNKDIDRMSKKDLLEFQKYLMSDNL